MNCFKVTWKNWGIYKVYVFDPTLKNFLKKNAILRKLFAFLRQFPRIVIRYTSSSLDYQSNLPILGNSFPKSGTHLLLQIIESLPGIRHYGSFIASMPSITFTERSQKAHLRLISNTIPGEVVPAHLFYHARYVEALGKVNCVHFFIYRDPRDVVVSEAYYLAEMNRWHRMHKYFTAIDNWDERISRAILGFKESGFPYDYPNVAERFSRYRGWLETPSVFSVRYEDLISLNRRKYLRKIAEFYFDHCEVDYSIDAIVEEMEANINPEASHTYRKGGSGGWREVFSEKHKAQMKKVAGDLLIDLGYENDFNW